MTSSADWTGVRPVTEKMPAAVLACGEQIEMKSPAETKMASRKLVQGRFRARFNSHPDTAGVRWSLGDRLVFLSRK